MDTATTKNQQLEIDRVFSLQQQNLNPLASSSVKQRKARLKKILHFLLEEENQEALCTAMYKDFKKPKAEVLLSEISVVLQHIRYILPRLGRWMSPQPKKVGLAIIGTRSFIQPDPKGNVLIIAPWNYPFQLAIQPLAYAIAAGNAVIIKPSEMTTHTSAFIKKMIEKLFPPEEIAVIEGAVETAQTLLKKPFNHIFFTGSPRVGKIVMAAAAKHLSSVTLELGGKSPAIIDRNTNIKTVAEKTAWGKCLNGGQTCIAPDYLLLHKDDQEAWVQAYQQALDKFYGAGEDAQKTSTSLARMIHPEHAKRLKNLIEDAVSKGAKVACGGQTEVATAYVAPTLLTNVNMDMSIMQEEIFGPVLPVINYETKADLLEIIEKNPYPLTAYLTSKRQKMIDWFVQNIRAGGMVVNDYLLGFSNPNLPFGGVNNSGIGKSMGKQGFIEFSNEKGVVQRRFGTMHFIFPPYTEAKERLMNVLGKWG